MTRIPFVPTDHFIKYPSIYNQPVEVIYSSLFTTGNGLTWEDEGYLSDSDIWFRDKEPATDGYMKLYDEYHIGLSKFRETQREYIESSLLHFSNQSLLRYITFVSINYCRFVEHDHIVKIDDYWYNVISRVREHLEMFINNQINQSTHPEEVSTAKKIAAKFDKTRVGKKVKEDRKRFAETLKRLINE